jgi:hypothetical protein
VFLRVMSWLAGIGSAYCVLMVTLSFIPAVPPPPIGLIVPAVVAAAPCFLLNLGLTGLRRQEAIAETFYLMGLAPRRVKAAALAAGAGIILTIVLTAPGLNRYDVGVMNGQYVRHQGNSPNQVISHAEYERQLRYKARVYFDFAGWFTLLPGVVIAGARRKPSSKAASPQP